MARYQKLKRYAAGASGATLGYILRGSAGVHQGYHIGVKIADRYGKGRSTAKRSIRPRQRSAPKRLRAKATKLKAGKRRRITSARRKAKPSWTSQPNVSGRLQGHTSYKQKYTSKVPAWFRRLMGPRMISYATTGTVPILQGTQAWANVGLYYSTASTGSAVMLNHAHIEDMYNQLMLDETPVTVGNAVNYGTTLPATTGNQTQRLWIDYVKTNVRFKNQTNRHLTMTLWTLTPRRNANSYNMPDSDWLEGMKDIQTNDVNNFDLRSWPGTSPLRSPLFKRNWAVLKKHTVTLAEGQEHNHKIFLSPRYPITRESLFSGNNPTGDQIFRGMTVMLMVTVVGSMVYDKNLSTDTTGNVTLSKGCLHYLVTGCERFQAIGRSRTLYTQNGGFDVTPGYEAALDDETHAIGDTAVVGPGF